MTHPGRLVLILYALILMGVGTGIALAPAWTLSTVLHLDVPSDAGTLGELRALGVMEAGVGWLAWHLRDDILERPDLRRALLVVLWCFPLARVLSLLVDGWPGAHGAQAITGELVFVALITWLTRPSPPRLPDDHAPTP